MKADCQNVKIGIRGLWPSFVYNDECHRWQPEMLLRPLTQGGAP
jgi:hypothetical protein